MSNIYQTIQDEAEMLLKRHTVSEIKEMYKNTSSDYDEMVLQYVIETFRSTDRTGGYEPSNECSIHSGSTTEI